MRKRKTGAEAGYNYLIISFIKTSFGWYFLSDDLSWYVIVISARTENLPAKSDGFTLGPRTIFTLRSINPGITAAQPFSGLSRSNARISTSTSK